MGFRNIFLFIVMKKVLVLGSLLLVVGVVFTGCAHQPTVEIESTEPAPVVTEPAAEPVVAQNIVYTNSTYNFTLTLPQTWEGYITRNRTVDWGTFGTSDSVDFGFADQDSLFNISVHAKDQWQQIQSEEGPKPTYLGENSQYVFAYLPAQDVTNDTMVARMAEVVDIVKTFAVAE